jgi:hypothetical protein
MSAWRLEAIKRFPKHTREIENAENTYDLWIDIRTWFETAYDDDNLELISQIYNYLSWTLDQPRGSTADNDLSTAASVCFVEHIPEHPKARADMPRWWSKELFDSYRPLFIYNLGQEEADQLSLEIYPRLA